MNDLETVTALSALAGYTLGRAASLFDRPRLVPVPPAAHAPVPSQALGELAGYLVVLRSGRLAWRHGELLPGRWQADRAAFGAAVHTPHEVLLCEARVVRAVKR